MLATNVRGNLAFNLVYVCPYGAHPVGRNGIVNPTLLVSMHGWAGKPDFVGEGCYVCKACIVLEVHYSAPLQCIDGRHGPALECHA